MRVQHRLALIRPLARVATAAMTAATLALAWGAGVADAGPLFAEPEGNPGDPVGSPIVWVAGANECVATPLCPWEGNPLAGEANVAVGPVAMPALTTASFNVALDHGANGELKTGSNNIAIGSNANFANKGGSNNIATGSEALKANIASNNIASGTEALFSNATGEHNIASGTEALKANTTGSDNVASGFKALFSNTEGHNDLAFGTEALKGNTTGSDNVASGFKALFSNTEGGGNVASGDEALFSNKTGEENVASGAFALLGNTTGSSNLALGAGAGKNLTTGSNNIDIANEGVAAESGTTRIGKEGTQTKAFVAGVYQKPIATPACAVKVNAEGQLGCNEEGPGNAAIATFASRKEVASGSCLVYTDIGPAGTGACAAKTTGFSSNTRLAGPTPANGATVTNLYADTSASVSGTDSVLVAVIDNTTGATLLSCTVNSTNVNHCSNSSGSAAAAGDNIEVKITATGESGNKKLWRVTFRF